MWLWNDAMFDLAILTFESSLGERCSLIVLSGSRARESGIAKHT